MSVAPRSRRLNSSILPRFRSQPIHACSPRSTAGRGETGRSGWRGPSPNLRLSASTPVARAVEDRRVLRRVGGVGVGEVAENREVDAGIEIAEREHLDVFEQRVDAVGARQHRRDDDHRAGGVGNAVGEVEARQPLRADDVDDRPLDARDREVARRQQHEQRDEDLDGGRGARAAARRRTAAASRAPVAIAIAPR